MLRRFLEIILPWVEQQLGLDLRSLVLGPCP